MVDSPRNKVEERLSDLFTYYKEDEMRPLICGEFTNWKPTRMLRIDEFAQCLDPKIQKNGFSFLERFKDDGNLQPYAKAANRVQDLNDEDKLFFEEFKKVTMDKYNKNWHEHLAE
jgi:hypothetical protein